MTQEQYYWYVLRPRQLRANAIAAAGYADGATEGGYWTCDEDEYGVAGTIVPYKGNFVWEDEDGCVLKRVGNEWILTHGGFTLPTTIAPADSKTLTFTNGKMVVHIYWVETEPTKYCFWVPNEESTAILGDISLEWQHGYNWEYTTEVDGHKIGYRLTRFGTTWYAYMSTDGVEEEMSRTTGAHDAKTLTFDYEGETIVMNYSEERPIIQPTHGGYWKLIDTDPKGTVTQAVLSAQSTETEAPTWTSIVDPGAGYLLGRKESNWYISRFNESGELIDECEEVATETAKSLTFHTTHILYHTLTLTWSETQPNLDEIVVNKIAVNDEADEAEAVKVDEAETEKTEDEKAEEKE